MVQKQNGVLQNLIKNSYKLCLFIILSICSFCNGQDNSSILNKPFLLEKYADKIFHKNNFLIIESEQLTNKLKENSKFLIKKGWQKVEHSNNSIIELIASSESNPLKIKPNTTTRYLFITMDEILKDTLKISKQFDYSICQLDKGNKKHGLAIGKYKIRGSNEFFEIYYLYLINNNGTFTKIDLKTTIFDCPAPIDYIKDEEPDSYTFGIKGGKKYSRYWYENNRNQ